MHGVVIWIVQDHFNDLFLVITAEGSEKNDNGNHISDLWNRGPDFTSSVWLFDVDLELKCWSVNFFVLRPYLDVKRVLARWKIVVENQHNITCLSFLRYNDLFRPINNEVASLIIQALLLSHNVLLIAITEMTLATPDHHWNLCQLNLHRRKWLANEITWLLLVSVSLLYPDIYLALDLVRQVSDPGLVREVWMPLLVALVNTHSLGIICHWLSPRVNISKLDLVANAIFFSLDTWNVLFGNAYNIVLILLNAVSDVILDEPVETGDLLVDNTVLLEERVDDVPLVVNVDLLLAIGLVYIWLIYNWNLSRNRCFRGLASCHLLSLVSGVMFLQVHLVNPLLHLFCSKWSVLLVSHILRILWE